MTHVVAPPTSTLISPRANLELASDFLELCAFLDSTNQVLFSELMNIIDIGQDEGYPSVNDELENGPDDIVLAVGNRIQERCRVLGGSYPFFTDEYCDVLYCKFDRDSLGQGAYLLSLLLSNIPLLDNDRVRLSDKEIRKLRMYFQFFATAGLAGELHGDAWSFGFPRPDHSPFLTKLREIWNVLLDGQVGRNLASPAMPKDGGVDVFAAHRHADGLPGFLLAVGQVATGKDWEDKSLRGRVRGFRLDWFDRPPRSDFICYLIVPFAISDKKFVHSVGRCGNILHRLRLPIRVEEARTLNQAGTTIEAFDLLQDAIEFILAYRDRSTA